ncbi:hypothetical protein [Microbispora sp. H10836]|uniref:hypothetical protein n=1 Tax=Microbispora sp. H10836 TaxID=2729106 RepID=UPI00147499D0|nr:hypothetical protein [Microbispora sp. H10836]
MPVFACAGCGAVLTAPVAEVALPVHAHQQYGHYLLPALMEPGTYAVDPEPSGQPWRPYDEVGAREAEARGVYAPVHALSYGPPGAIALSPGDVRGTVPILERCDGLCCGLDGRNGPNLACERCGREAATRIDDCSYWHVVWLDPRAVRLADAGGSPRRMVAWEELRDELTEIPPTEPIGAWSPVWEAAVAAALARLLAVSGGARVAVPAGPVAGVFRPALDVLLPPGPPVKSLSLAGPGLPAATSDIALVPRHPQSGEAWPYGAGAVVPLTAEVWTYLAFHDDRRLIAVAGGRAGDACREAPAPLVPYRPFRPDWGVFLGVLARLPEVREPWLRAIYDRVRKGRYSDPFL